MKTAAAFLLTLFLASPAVGQDAKCKPYTEFIAAASDHFKALRGQQVGPSLFASTAAFPEFSQCVINTYKDFQLLCHRTVRSEAVARKEYELLMSEAAACLPGWATKPPIDVNNGGPAEFIAGIRLIKLHGAGDITVGVGFMREEANKQIVHHVAISFLLSPAEALF